MKRPLRVLDDELHVLHLQREAADRPFEALEVGGARRRRVAEIANVLVALVDLELLPVELLLQVPILKLQSLQVAGGCHAGGPTAGVGRKKKTPLFLPWVIGSYRIGDKLRREIGSGRRPRVGDG